jgi:hypothetical protein
MKKVAWAFLILPVAILGLFGLVKFQQTQQYDRIDKAVDAQISSLNSIKPERVIRWCISKEIPERKNCTVLRYKVDKQQCLAIQKHLDVESEKCTSRTRLTQNGHDFVVQLGGIYEEPPKYGLYVEVYSTESYILSEWL